MKPQHKIVLCYGHFSTIHAGHIRYLRYALGIGNSLYIALRGDGSSQKYAFSQPERLEALELLGLAHRIIPLVEDELEEIVNSLKPSIVLLGQEFKDEQWITRLMSVAREYGGDVVFHSGTTGQSSNELIGSSESAIETSRKKQFLNALKRQNINVQEMLDSVDSWKNAKLVVIGDTIIDQFSACDAIGLSAEAPIVVVKEMECEDFIGGGAIVAAHIKSLGCQCSYISVVGDDRESHVAEAALSNWDVSINLIRDKTRPTTLKKRYVVGNQKIFRVSRLEDRDIDRGVEEQIIERLRLLGSDADGIVVSDFNYGVITERVLEEIRTLKKRLGFRVFGDSQSSSQVGKLASLHGFTLLTPNEKEARLACGFKDWSVEQLANKILREFECHELILKLGQEGLIAYERSADGRINNQPFPALTANPVDVAGAGDSVLSVMAAGLCSSQRTMVTASIACCMAAMAVKTMGNKPIDSKDLKEYIERQIK